MVYEVDETMTTSRDYDRQQELKSFDKTKAGVKGVVDDGVTKLPRIFIQPAEELIDHPVSNDVHLKIPVIDLEGIHIDISRRHQVIQEVLLASETWGIFQLVNHGIPVHVLDEMIEGVRRFNEQPNEAKSEYYTREQGKQKVVFNSNFNLFTAPAACWRDTFVADMAPTSLKPEELPEECSDVLIEYSDHVMRLGLELLELISESLGLEPNHLKDMGCGEQLFVAGHYYPACPEPELALGAHKHTDKAFIAILLQDQIGGLQVLYQNHWSNIQPIHGALVINIGDFLQIMSNDKLKSTEHRVIANIEGPRVSMACFLTKHQSTNVFGPIKELLSEENRPIYRDTTITEFLASYNANALNGKITVNHFKL